MMLDNRCYRM